jgi:hypothetical protein
MLNAFLALALLVGYSAKMISGPWPGGAPKNVLEVLLWAYQTYLDGFYLVLSSPFP